MALVGIEALFMPPGGAPGVSAPDCPAAGGGGGGGAAGPQPASNDTPISTTAALAFERHPEWRFGRAFARLDIADPFMKVAAMAAR